MHGNKCCNSWSQKCDHERSCENFKIQGPQNRNSVHVECESKSDIGNYKANWNHFKITQTIPKQHTRKARHLGDTKNSHIGHCTHTTESTNVKVQNTLHRRNDITCSTNCKYRTATTLYTLETWFVSGT